MRISDGRSELCSSDLFLVAAKVGEIKAKGGTLKADGQLAGSPSVLFDAVASVLTADAAAKLAKDGAAVQWFMDAFGHCKTIAHSQGSQSLLDKAHVEPDDGVVAIEQFMTVGERKSVVGGKGVSGRVELGGRPIM